ncbi:MAG: hypothetical protein U1E03_11425 [Hyphomonadaceae bacterium]
MHAVTWRDLRNTAVADQNTRLLQWRSAFGHRKHRDMLDDHSALGHVQRLAGAEHRQQPNHPDEARHRPTEVQHRKLPELPGAGM